MITLFNFYDYLKNPIADFCCSKYKSPKIYTLDDIQPFAKNLKHLQAALDGKMPPSYIGDQLRLYLSTLYDDFLYVDADCFIPEQCMKEILSHKNCTAYEKQGNWINNGTFFHSDHDCRFNHYYLDIYNQLSKKDSNLCNYNVYKKYPFELDLVNMKSGDMNLLELPVHHFYLSSFYFFRKSNPDIDTVYYSLSSNPDADIKNNENYPKIFWQLINCPRHIYKRFMSNRIQYYYVADYKFIPLDDMVRLFKEQMNYTYQRKLKFVEV